MRRVLPDQRRGSSQSRYQDFARFGIDAATAGVGHARSDAHAPNENIYVADFVRGIKHICLIMERFASV